MFTSGEVSPDWLAALRVAYGPDPWRYGFFLVHPESGALIGTADALQVDVVRAHPLPAANASSRVLT